MSGLGGGVLKDHPLPTSDHRREAGKYMSAVGD